MNMDLLGFKGYNEYGQSRNKRGCKLLKRYVKLLTVLTCIGMFLVLIAGVLVTKLDAGRGCGDDWPLCNGKFIPAYTLESLVEYNHRLISGIVGILVLITFIAVWRHMKERRDAVFYAASALFFTVVQAILGAMAVVWPQSDPVLALHFGISLIAFASTLLLVIAVRKSLDAPRTSTGITFRYMMFVWSVTAFCYVVVYLGALVRHTESFAGCLGWPLCNGQWIPELTGGTGINFIHRLSALVLVILVVILTWMTAKRRMDADLRKSAYATMITLVLQVLSGAWVTFALFDENIFVFTALVHTVIIAALFSILSYMSIEMWRRRNL